MLVDKRIFCELTFLGIYCCTNLYVGHCHFETLGGCFTAWCTERVEKGWSPWLTMTLPGVRNGFV